MSNNIDLLPDEQVVTSSDNGALILTTKRVRYHSFVWGGSHLVSITLGSVASCGLITKSYPFLLFLGAIVFLSAIIPGSNVPSRGTLFVVAGILIAAYFFTRKAFISVASNGGKAILAPAQGIKREVIMSFIEAVEREKLK